MIKKHEKTAISLDEVLREYSDATENFDADILDEYLNRYPDYAERLRNYASVWLMSSFATPDEIASEVVPDQEMLVMQSKLLSRLHSLKPSKEQTKDIGKVIERLNSIKGIEEFDRVTRKVLGNLESEEEELLIEEYLDPGLEKEPSWIKERLSQVLGCLPEVIPVALFQYRLQVSHHYSSTGKPVKKKPRSWVDAVEELTVSNERKKTLCSASLENEK